MVMIYITTLTTLVVTYVTYRPFTVSSTSLFLTQQCMFGQYMSAWHPVNLYMWHYISLDIQQRTIKVFDIYTRYFLPIRRIMWFIVILWHKKKQTVEKNTALITLNRQNKHFCLKQKSIYYIVNCCWIV